MIKHFKPKSWRPCVNKLPSECLKITQNVSFEFLNFGFSCNFCPVKNDLSGNTVWLKTSVFQKIFGILNETFSVIFKLSVSWFTLDIYYLSKEFYSIAVFVSETNDVQLILVDVLLLC